MSKVIVNTTLAFKNAHIRRNRVRRTKYAPLSSLDFSNINRLAIHLADFIENNFEAITKILLKYESFEVVQDETARTLDLLRNLHENKSYFRLRIGSISSFLPKNQPLYALTCFVIIPSFLASEVHFRIPHSMRFFFPDLLKILNISELFPNIIVSKRERLEFLRERSALLVNTKTQESWPVTDAVIFTGTSAHADRLRLVFDSRTLFIANGSGHNPVVVTNNADLARSVEAALALQLYNQGQDCAAPNAILVQKNIFPSFYKLLREKIKLIYVGKYEDRLNKVGPISDPEDLIRIQSLLIEHRQWIDPSTPGVIRSFDAILEPTIISKPLEKGGNFTELFAPIIFLQEYNEDLDLAHYFESPHYARNAMYISIFGKSKYVDSLIEKKIGDKILHYKDSVLYEKHLHMSGVERGVKAYGGCGYSASNLSINSKIICKATLPQRDIYEWIAKPLLRGKNIEKHKAVLSRVSKIVYKDVSKILGLKISTSPTKSSLSTELSYIDTRSFRDDGKRYVRVRSNNTFQLLQSKNATQIAKLEPRNVHLVQAVRTCLIQNKSLSVDDFTGWLYALTKKPGATESENQKSQLNFFTILYQLLLGQDSGPRLANFLLDVEKEHIGLLLDV